MSVELLDTPRFYGYRVRRQIQGKTYQEYFSLKAAGKRIRGERHAQIKAAAEARDRELAAQQETLQRRRAKEVHVDGQGQVRGILCRLKSEKSGNKTPVFQIGVMSLLEDRIVNTTVSINKFGVEEAWRRAVDFYARHKQISKRSGAYKALIAAQPSEAQVRRLMQSGGGSRKRAPAGRKSTPEGRQSAAESRKRPASARKRSTTKNEPSAGAKRPARKKRA